MPDTRAGVPLDRELEKAQAKVLARIQAAQGGPSAGPIRQGSGNLIWPVNGPVVSGFGMLHLVWGAHDLDLWLHRARR